MRIDRDHREKSAFCASLVALTMAACGTSSHDASPTNENVVDAGHHLEPIAGDPPARVTLGQPASPPAPKDAGAVDSASSASPYAGLVINEVDYDEPGIDDAEFIELYNGSPQAIDLQRLALVMTTASAEYGRVALSGTLPAGGYAVAAGSKVVFVSDAGVLRFAFTAPSNAVRNTGPAAVGILDLDRGTLVDALSYGGAVTKADVVGVAQPLDFVEGNATSIVDSDAIAASLARAPNGSDTDDAATDWRLTKTITPGGANVITP